jgi:hypothetical protein
MNEIITHLISATAIVSLIGYIGQKALDAILNSKFEKYKQKIDFENELFKSKLSLIAKEHEVKFTALHEERGAVIQKFYMILSDYIDFVRAYVQVLRAPNSFGEDFKNGSFEIFHKLLEFTKYNKIYFSKKFYGEYEIFEVEAEKMIHAISSLDMNANKETLETAYNNFTTIINEKILPLKSGIEEEFRVLLGV